MTYDGTAATSLIFFTIEINAARSFFFLHTHTFRQKTFYNLSKLSLSSDWLKWSTLYHDILLLKASQKKKTSGDTNLLVFFCCSSLYYFNDTIEQTFISISEGYLLQSPRGTPKPVSGRYNSYTPIAIATDVIVQRISFTDPPSINAHATRRAMNYSVREPSAGYKFRFCSSASEDLLMR